MLLLDTCTLLWLVADQAHLTKKATDSILDNQGLIYVSAISAFEIAIKVKKKKLQLKKEPFRVVPACLEFAWNY